MHKRQVPNAVLALPLQPEPPCQDFFFSAIAKVRNLVDFRLTRHLDGGNLQEFWGKKQGSIFFFQLSSTGVSLNFIFSIEKTSDDFDEEEEVAGNHVRWALFAVEIFFSGPKSNLAAGEGRPGALKTLVFMHSVQKLYFFFMIACVYLHLRARTRRQEFPRGLVILMGLSESLTG